MMLIRSGLLKGIVKTACGHLLVAQSDQRIDA
jgi:hypothetical protein